MTLTEGPGRDTPQEMDSCHFCVRGGGDEGPAPGGTRLPSEPRQQCVHLAQLHRGSERFRKVRVGAQVEVKADCAQGLLGARGPRQAWGGWARQS